MLTCGRCEEQRRQATAEAEQSKVSLVDRHWQGVQVWRLRQERWNWETHGLSWIHFSPLSRRQPGVLFLFVILTCSPNYDGSESDIDFNDAPNACAEFHCDACAVRKQRTRCRSRTRVKILIDSQADVLFEEHLYHICNVGFCDLDCSLWGNTLF